jgi:putative colanic acid biosynthesis acetyltransferase WcaF
MKSTDTRSFYSHAYANTLSTRNKLARLAWAVCHALLFRPSPRHFHGFRRWLLRRFGATIASTAEIYPSARIWAPWNLTVAHRACVGPEVNCYSVAAITLEPDATVSERTFLCTASHDIHSADRHLVTGPITISRGAFVFAEAFIGMSVVIGDGAVVAARAVVVRDVAPFSVVAGNPARVVGERRYRGE